MPGRVIRAVREGATEAARVWSARAWLALAVVVTMAAAPAVLGSGALRDVTSALYVMLAAIGLNFALGLGGMPSLGQGAFVVVGAFAAALLRTRLGWDPLGAALAASAVAAVSGAVLGAAAVRLRPAFLAIATWVGAWLVGSALAAFPWLFGGAQGIPMPPPDVPLPFGGATRLAPAGQYALALALVVAALLAFRSLSRGGSGRALAAVRAGESVSGPLGVRAARLRFGLFVASAAIGGLAGALSVQVAGIADPTRSVPQLSVELFVAVLIGGAGTALGPVVGSAALLAIPFLAERLGSLAGAAPERFEPAVAAVLLVVAVALGGRGLVGWATALWTRLRRPRAESLVEVHADRASLPALPPAAGPALDLVGVTKRFGGLHALAGVSLPVAAGELHALVGPNGSGKSTLLRIAAGTMRADTGTVAIGDADATDLGPRERLLAGVVRVPQRTAIAPDLTALEHVALGAAVRRRYGGVFRSTLLTPKARAEDARVRARAAALLEALDLAHVAGRRAGRLGAGERRLLMLATALASDPAVLLLDEPAAGMSVEETERLARALAVLRERGLGILLVEHDFPLVLRLADRVTVLEAGRVIALGPPAEVARDPEVIEAYLGAEE